MWENRAASPEAAFRHENTIKIGEDRYIATGFQKTTGRTVFSAREIEDLMAQATYGGGGAAGFGAYRDQNVFVREVETFRGIPKPKAR